MKYFLISIFIFFFLSAAAHAATLSLTGNQRGTIVSVDVLLDTGGVPVNSADVRVRYPNDRMTFKGFQGSAGIITFWIQQPAADGGTIHFVGGIPGGAVSTYGASSGPLTLTRLLFEVRAGGTGSANFSIDQSTVLQNDGKGTALAHDERGATIALAEPVPGTVAGAEETAADTTAPLPFSVQYVPRDRANRTPALLIFGTTDRDSGISGYQVKLGWSGVWRDAASPYPLPSRLFSYVANVRAIDSYGNRQWSSVAVPGIVPLPIGFGVGIIALVVFDAGLYAYFVVKKKV